jgi:hypothetical protein
MDAQIQYVIKMLLSTQQTPPSAVNKICQNKTVAERGINDPNVRVPAHTMNSKLQCSYPPYSNGKLMSL